MPALLCHSLCLYCSRHKGTFCAWNPPRCHKDPAKCKKSPGRKLKMSLAVYLRHKRAGVPTPRPMRLESGEWTILPQHPGQPAAGPASSGEKWEEWGGCRCISSTSSVSTAGGAWSRWPAAWWSWCRASPGDTPAVWPPPVPSQQPGFQCCWCWALILEFQRKSSTPEPRCQHWTQRSYHQFSSPFLLRRSGNYSNKARSCLDITESNKIKNILSFLGFRIIGSNTSFYVVGLMSFVFINDVDNIERDNQPASRPHRAKL